MKIRRVTVEMYGPSIACVALGIGQNWANSNITGLAQALWLGAMTLSFNIVLI